MFRDRSDAGRRLAGRLAAEGLLRAGDEVVVVGLPRGGVPVAAEVARRLGAPLDVIVVRKLGVPDQPELAFGAIGEGGVRVLNPAVLAASGMAPVVLDAVEAQERARLDARVRRLRAARPAVPLEARTVVVVDDGIATGSTVAVACRIARARRAARVVVAVPVGPTPTPQAVVDAADAVVVVEQPERLAAVGYWYRDFSPVTDDDVVHLLGLRDQPP